jgi:hypothetical protein
MRIIILDTVGPPYDMTKCLGGAAVAVVVMAAELRARGHEVTVSREVPECAWTDALIVNRYSPIPHNIHAKRTVVWAHEFGDARHDIHRGQTFVCVSHHQAKSFAHLGRTVVIPPMLGRHVARVSPPVLGLWVYASAEDKGLDDSLAAWQREPPAGASRLLVCTRDYDPGESVKERCATAGAVWLPPRSPDGMVALLSACEGLWYHERAAEAFSVTLAIARHLGLKINHRHVGHSSCGVDEAFTADMSPETVCRQWEEVLSG